MHKWLPRWMRPGNGYVDDVCVYISPSACALACRRRSDDGEVHVSLRADPVQSIGQVQAVLARQVDTLRCRDAVVKLVLAPDFYKLSLIERPHVQDDELIEALRWQLQESSDFDMGDAALDIFPLPESASRNRPMVFAAAAANSQLRTLLDVVHGAGLRIDNIDIVELALRNLVYKLYDAPDQAVGVLRITASGGLINVSRGDQLFLARRLSGVPMEYSDAVWEEFKDRLLLQVQRSIDYYESALSQPPCNILFVATTQGWQEHVIDHLSEMLPLPVKPLGPELASHFDITLYNPEPVVLDWNTATVAQINAVAAATPALGGVLEQDVEMSA